MRVLKYRFLVAITAFALSVTAKTCYYPDGSPDVAIKPCDSSADVSTCCRSTDSCLSNNLCFSTGLNVVYRRGCTDPTWNSSSCPRFLSKWLVPFLPDWDASKNIQITQPAEWL